MASEGGAPEKEPEPLCAQCGKPRDSGRVHETGDFGRSYSHEFVAGQSAGEPERAETSEEYARYQQNIRARAAFLILRKQVWNGDEDKAWSEFLAFVRQEARGAAPSAPEGHDWQKRPGFMWEACGRCGKVRQPHSEAAPCKPVSVVPRGPSAPEGSREPDEDLIRRVGEQIQMDIEDELQSGEMTNWSRIGATIRRHLRAALEGR